MKLKSLLSKWSLLAMAAVLLSSTAGCGALLTYEANSTVYDGKNDVTEKNFEDDEFLVEMANRYGLMALFAETVYRGELDKDVRDDQGCKYLEPGWPGEINRGMPKIPGSTSGWERWVPEGAGEKPCMNDPDGLFYETYVHRDGDTLTEAVIAFRGTENRKGQAAWDWSTNLSAALGMEPAQYKTAREHLPDLIQRLLVANKQMKIYAVGHSLGGGLAQQAGYLSGQVQEVFTFNTSPVTNWTRLRLKGLVAQGFPIIHRIYHGGEGLEVPRFVATSATSARFGRHDIGVQFGKRQFASGHSMKILSCNFALILSKRKVTTAAHDYPTAYIDKQVLKLKDAPVTQEPGEPHPRICDDDSSNKGHDDPLAK